MFHWNRVLRLIGTVALGAALGCTATTTGTGGGTGTGGTTGDATTGAGSGGDVLIADSGKTTGGTEDLGKADPGPASEDAPLPKDTGSTAGDGTGSTTGDATPPDDTAFVADTTPSEDTPSVSDTTPTEDTPTLSDASSSDTSTSPDGTSPDGTFTETGDTGPTISGKCLIAQAVQCGDKLTGLVIAAGATSAFGTYTCDDPEFGTDYGGSGEIIVSFTSPTQQLVTVDTTNTFDVDIIRLEDAGNGCEDTLSTCKDIGIGDLSFEAQAGKTYYFVLEGYDGPPSGPFGLDVTCCKPNCDGKVCGTDGCGGTCGAGCKVGENCNAGACEAAPTTCTAVKTVGCGESLTGLTNGGPGSTYAFSTYPCQVDEGDTFTASPELTYAFTNPSNTKVKVTSDGEGSLNLTVLKAIEGQCTATEDSCIDQSYGDLTFDAAAGETYYLVWDSYSTSSPIDSDFDVTICCLNCDGVACGQDDGCGGTCGCNAGSLCTEGKCVEQPTTCAPIAAVKCGDKLTGLSNGGPGATLAFSKYTCQSFSSDDYTGSPEAVYSLTLDSDQNVTVSMTNSSSVDITVLEDVGAGCGDSKEACLDQGSAEVTFAGKAGKTYYLVMDSYSASAPVVSGIDLEVTCCVSDCAEKPCGADDGCGGTCGCAEGGVCVAGTCKTFEPTCNPTPIKCGDKLTGVSNGGDGAGLSFSKYACQNYSSDDYSASPETIYALSLDADQFVTFDLTGSLSVDVTVLSGLGEACNPTKEQCLLQDSTTAEFQGKAGQTYYFVLDSYNDPVVTDIDVEVICCTPSCDLAACGQDDGCGKPCGCGPGNACDTDTSTCKAAAEGDTCAAPLPVAALGAISGDLSGLYANDYELNGCGSISGADPGVKDAVYAYSPTETGTYLITMPTYDWLSGGASLLAVFGVCDTTSACLGGADWFYESPETFAIEVAMTAGTTYYIVIDGYSSFDEGPFSFTIAKK